MTRLSNILIATLLVAIAGYAMYMSVNQYVAARDIAHAVNGNPETTIAGLYNAGQRYSNGTPEITVEMMKVFARSQQARTYDNGRMALATARTAIQVEPDNWQVAAALSQLYAANGQGAESGLWLTQAKELAPERIR